MTYQAILGLYMLYQLECSFMGAVIDF